MPYEKKSDIELGIEHSRGQFNDFHRCQSEQCKDSITLFYVNALGRTTLIRCPNCNETMSRS